MEDLNLDALARDLGFILKSEQKEAVESLLRGRDVFGVLPTGFRKSLIYQLSVLAKNASPKAVSSVERPTIIVICPLKSIIEEQITSNEFNFRRKRIPFVQFKREINCNYFRQHRQRFTVSSGLNKHVF